MQFILIDDGINQFGLPGPMTKITMEHNESSLAEILEQFENFLKACGFHFDGQISIDYEANMVAPMDDGSEI